MSTVLSTYCRRGLELPLSKRVLRVTPAESAKIRGADEYFGRSILARDLANSSVIGKLILYSQAEVVLAISIDPRFTSLHFAAHP